MKALANSRSSLGGALLSLGWVLVGGLFLSACQKDSTEPALIDPSGVYTLVMIDDQAVPAQVKHGEMAVEVRSGLFTINADGTCLSQTVFAPPGREAMTREVTATYTFEGATLTLQWDGAGTTIGMIDGDTFTMSNEGMRFIYRK